MAQQAKVVKVGPGGRNNGPRPKVENPGKVFKRILAYVMSRYKAQVIVVLCCILLAVFAQLQGLQPGRLRLPRSLHRGQGHGLLPPDLPLQQLRGRRLDGIHQPPGGRRHARLRHASGLLCRRCQH